MENIEVRHSSLGPCSVVIPCVIAGFNTRIKSFRLLVQIQKKSEHSFSQAIVFGDV